MEAGVSRPRICNRGNAFTRLFSLALYSLYSCDGKIVFGELAGNADCKVERLSEIYEFIHVF